MKFFSAKVCFPLSRGEEVNIVLHVVKLELTVPPFHVNMPKSNCPEVNNLDLVPRNIEHRNSL